MHDQGYIRNNAHNPQEPTTVHPQRFMPLIPEQWQPMMDMTWRKGRGEKILN